MDALLPLYRQRHTGLGTDFVSVTQGCRWNGPSWSTVLSLGCGFKGTCSSSVLSVLLHTHLEEPRLSATTPAITSTAIVSQICVSSCLLRVPTPAPVSWPSRAKQLNSYYPQVGGGKTGGQGSRKEGGREGIREVGSFALVFFSAPEPGLQLDLQPNLHLPVLLTLLFFLLSKLSFPHSWTLLIYFMP